MSNGIVEQALNESATKPILCIVSVYRPDLLGHAQRALGDRESVEIIVDRRIGERRQPSRAESEETKARDRRRMSPDDLLRTQGFAIIQRPS